MDPAFLAKNPSQKTNREPTIEPSVKHRPWGLTTSNILSPHELQGPRLFGFVCTTIFYQTILECYMIGI